MNVSVRLWASMLGVAVFLGSAVLPAGAQNTGKQHVITSEELNQQTAQPAQTRHAGRRH